MRLVIRGLRLEMGRDKYKYTGLRLEIGTNIRVKVMSLGIPSKVMGPGLIAPRGCADEGVDALPCFCVLW